jgi:hypothetical protein
MIFWRLNICSVGARILDLLLCCFAHEKNYNKLTREAAKGAQHHRGRTKSWWRFKYWRCIFTMLIRAFFRIKKDYNKLTREAAKGAQHHRGRTKSIAAQKNSKLTVPSMYISRFLTTLHFIHSRSRPIIQYQIDFWRNTLEGWKLEHEWVTFRPIVDYYDLKRHQIASKYSSFFGT